MSRSFLRLYASFEAIINVVYICVMAQKFFLLFIIVSLIAKSTFAQKQTIPKAYVDSRPLCETAFVWQSGYKGKYWDKHMALLIPVALNHAKTKMYMQLDTGSPKSFLYENRAIEITYAQDTSRKDIVVEVGAGERKMSLHALNVVKLDSQQKHSSDIIGTLGTDFLDKKIVVVDYPNRRLMIFEQITSALEQGLIWSPLIYEQGNLLFPSDILGKSKLLYFDTGSSAFDLLVNKESWLAMAAKDSASNSYEVESWGRKLTAHSVASTASVKLAGSELPVQYVTYIDGATDSQINRMMSLGIGGMIGNKLFLNSKLVIDTKNKRYGILPAK